MSQSYTPLYRKYRPQVFADLVGQEVVVKALSNAINLDKISHAYLFCGSRGTGKTSAARILAKSLNCLNGPTPTPCGECANCISVTAGNAIDVTEIDAASNNSVEDARDILEKVQFVPVSGKYKIFIIDEVHMLSNSAFNTLLKTLEEPPENLVFILATTEPHKILDTIISRCQRFDFRKIKIEDIQNRLRYIADKENIKISNEAIELISQKSTGGLRDAIALIDQASVLGLAGNEISTNDILSISGAISQDNLYSLTESLAKKDSATLIELISAITSQGNEPILVLNELVSYFRNLLIVKAGGSSEQLSNLLAVSEQIIPKLQEQAKFFETIEIAQIVEKMSEYEVMLKNTTNTMMWLEVALISIAHRQDIKVMKDLEQRVSRLEAALSGNEMPSRIPAPPQSTLASQPVATAPAPAPKPSIEQTQPKPVQAQQVQQEAPKQEMSSQPNIEAPKSTATSQPTQQAPAENGGLKQEWVNILNNMSSIPAKMFFMQSATPISVSREGIVLSFRNEVMLKGAKEGTKAIQLEEAIQKAYGKVPKIDLVTMDEAKDIKKKANQPNIEISSEPVATISDIDKPETVAPEVINKTTTTQEPKIEPTAAVSTTTTQKAEAPPAKKIEPIQIEQNIDDNLNILDEAPTKEVLEESNPRKDYADDTRMVIDLFQGKIIE